ncbi:MAG: single-stranded DNA-binding protein [Thaumarchaeota archaeon]|nr:single-stranded DNA-binding protein [Nitrososphaerota archaeon]
MSTFSDFKKKSKTSIDVLVKKFEEEEGSKKDYKDERFWRPTLDKAKNGFAIIRFLPTIDGEDIPWVKFYSHAFQGPGGWYIENSLTTLGKQDPVSEMNSLLWKSGMDSDKDLARQRKRKLNYISNILVVSDPANPQNEGKVFLFKYGQKIFEKIQEAMQPEFKDEDPIDPFNFWTGANFKLKVRNVGGYVNYDKSEFDSPSPLGGGDDAQLEKIWRSQHSLKEHTNPSNFKTYEELKTKLESVLKGDIRGKAPMGQRTVEDVDEEELAEKQWGGSSKTKKPPVEDEVDDSTDALEYFKKLAND